MKTALVIGATGLVGRALLDELLLSKSFDKVLVFGRRTVGVQHAKLEEHLIDFDAPDSWKQLVKGDVLFSTLGTTLKQAGGKSAQYKIDYTYQYAFACAAVDNGVPSYVLVSSPGASPDAKIFYTRMKGELERDIRKLTFLSVTFIQPGLLYGDRIPKRFGEDAAFVVLKAFNAIGLFHGYRPIHGRVVAKAMIRAALKSQVGVQTYTLDKVFELAGER